MTDKQRYSIKDLANLLNVSERSAWTYIGKYGIRKDYLHTERGRETRICEEEVQRLLNLLSDRVQGFSETECSGIGYPAGTPLTQHPQVVHPLAGLQKDELVEVLREAFRKALQDVDFAGNSRVVEPVGAGRWTLFTGAALVTAMAVVAVAIMQHTLAIA